MIQKARNYQLAFLQSKYAIDKFHNPYLSKFTLKIMPSIINNNKEKNFNQYFISPFQQTNKIYFSQFLPVYKSQRFRASLIWKQTLKKNSGRGFIGLSSEYKADNMWALKSKAMFGGSMILYDLQAIKKIDHQSEVLVYHHGLYSSSNYSPLIGVGGRKKQFSGTIHKRFGFGYNAVLQYTKPLPHDLVLNARTQFNLSQNMNIDSLDQNNSVTLDYYFDQTIKARIGASHYIGQKQAQGLVQVQKSTETYGNFIFCVQYKGNSSVISFGYKNPTLNLILPVLAIDNPWPAIAAASGYILGYIFRNKSARKIQLKSKQSQVRLNELKLISDKANANYQKQQNTGQRGLLIQQAYVGPATLIDRLQQSPQNQRGVLLIRDPQIKENVFDLTMCLRFYVMRGQLRLKKGDKTHLLGFYCKDINDEMLIKYQKAGEINQIRVKMTDDILIR